MSDQSSRIDVHTPGKVPSQSITHSGRCKCPMFYKPTRKRSPGILGFTDPLVFPAGALAELPPSGIADNLLLASVSSDPLKLTFPVPDSIKDPDGDSVQLIVDGAPLDPAVTFKGKKPGDTFEIDLPASVRTEGTHTIIYRVIYSGSGNESGPAQSFIVDLTKPGEPLLAELIVDELIKTNGLTSDKLKEEDGEQYLECTVAGYGGLAPGDIIEGAISSTLRSRRIARGSMRRRPKDGLTLRFLRADIEALGDGTLVFTYKITDRAGNVSDMSLPLTLKVLLKGELKGLLAPLIAAHTDGLIIDAEAREPLELVVPAHTGTPAIQPGDKIELVWGDAVHELVPIPGGEEGNPQTLYPSYAALYDTWKKETAGANLVASIDVFYRIIRNGIVAGTSQITTVAVNLFQVGGDPNPDPEDPVHPNLRPPYLETASKQYNEIPSEEFDQDATIYIPLYDRKFPPRKVLEKDDKVLVFYGEIKFPVRTVTEQEANGTDDLRFPLTADQIAQEGSGTKPLHFLVTRAITGGKENTSRSYEQPITVHGNDELPGEGSLDDGRYFPVRASDGWITKEQIALGVKFITPHYANKKPGDTISIELYQAAGRSHDAGETPIDGSRYSFLKTVGEDDKDKETEFEIPAHHLLFPNDFCHMHATWTATNEFGPVSNTTTPLVIVDTRGDNAESENKS
ncbi:hypothetical protein PUR31_00375 [Pseudomonas mosselii]|uniref:hypothetical protein n=1 Tax=unclassified Pseudomonas TaxID=196821 RepID=UPI0020C50124|nr:MULTISPECIES: hypothetical protein [unclassified Pseudomonas]MCP8632299.1 hypothetical protein [Pseudomonas sp. DVZ6]MDD7782544.1 hypothetical protein [Pseudomonas sp. DVZ24]